MAPKATKANPQPVENNDNTGGVMDVAGIDLDKCMELIETLLNERDVTRATVADLTKKFDALTVDKAELERRFNEQEQELAELKQGGQLVRDRAAKILLRLQGANISAPSH